MCLQHIRVRGYHATLVFYIRFFEENIFTIIYANYMNIDTMHNICTIIDYVKLTYVG